MRENLKNLSQMHKWALWIWLQILDESEFRVYGIQMVGLNIGSLSYPDPPVTSLLEK